MLDRLIVGSKEAAMLLGITPQHFFGLIKAHRVPYEQRGKPGTPWRFNRNELLRWWGEYQERATSPNAKKHGDHRERKAAAEAEMAEIQLAQIKRELIPVAEIMPPIERRLTVLRQQLLAVPSKLGPVCNPSDPDLARKTLDEGIRQLLDEFSTGLEAEIAV